MSWPPRTLRAQLGLLVLGALLAAQVVSLWLFVGERGLAVRAVLGLEAAARAANVALLLEEAPESLHASILRAADSPLVRFSVGARPVVGAEDRGDGRAIAARVREMMGGARDRQVRVDLHELRTWRRDAPRGMERVHREMMGMPLAAVEMRLSIALAGGSWLNVATRFHRPPLQSPWAATASFLVTAAATLGVAGWFLLDRITGPLARLAAAADRLGRGESVAPLPEAGPDEVRGLTAAFNRMQGRLTRFVSDRTQLLAALGHDLRSPLTALRVRAEMVDDDETRERMVATIEEMQEMVEATLAFARGVTVAEPSEPVDLAALLSDLQADFEDTGARVTLAATPDVVARARPLALRRALRNLVDNACRYGDGAELRLDRAGNEARITIADRGPGIPESEIERAFDPFVRLETSRSRETGGTGLGLSIARTIVQAHGGELTLANRPQGGLVATLRLPLDPHEDR